MRPSYLPGGDDAEGDPLTAELPQHPGLSLGRDGRVGEDEQHQRHELLQHGGGGQRTEPWDRRRLGRGPVPELIPAVRLQEARRAHVVQHARIEEGQLGNRLKHVGAEVRRRVRILRPLSEPLLADQSLRPDPLGPDLDASAPPLGAGDHEERQEHSERPSHPAVAQGNAESVRAIRTNDPIHHGLTASRRGVRGPASVSPVAVTPPRDARRRGYQSGWRSPERGRDRAP